MMIALLLKKVNPVVSWDLCNFLCDVMTSHILTLANEGEASGKVVINPVQPAVDSLAPKTRRAKYSIADRYGRVGLSEAQHSAHSDLHADKIGCC